MGKRIVIIDGHPDPSDERFCHALAAAYAEGAQAAGHTVRTIRTADIDIPFLRSATEWSQGTPPPDIRAAQEAIGWAEHLLVVYPLWQGAMPALLKAFFEQIGRPGFAVAREATFSPGLLKGRSARIVVTMGMPALIYRFFFRAHSLKSFERNVLKICGIGPIRETLIGSVEASAQKRTAWLGRLRTLGRSGT